MVKIILTHGQNYSDPWSKLFIPMVKIIHTLVKIHTQCQNFSPPSVKLFTYLLRSIYFLTYFMRNQETTRKIENFTHNASRSSIEFPAFCCLVMRMHVQTSRMQWKVHFESGRTRSSLQFGENATNGSPKCSSIFLCCCLRKEGTVMTAVDSHEKHACCCF